MSERKPEQSAVEALAEACAEAPIWDVDREPHMMANLIINHLPEGWTLEKDVALRIAESRRLGQEYERLTRDDASHDARTLEVALKATDALPDDAPNVGAPSDRYDLGWHERAFAVRAAWDATHDAQVVEVEGRDGVKHHVYDAQTILNAVPRDDASHDCIACAALHRFHDARQHKHVGSVAREINPECWCGLLKATPHDHKREGPNGTGDLIGVAREREPKTEAGRWEAFLNHPRNGIADKDFAREWLDDAKAEIEAEAVQPWRKAFRQAARDRHGLSYIAEARTPFDECKKPNCVAARALLDESDHD